MVGGSPQRAGRGANAGLADGGPGDDPRSARSPPLPCYRVGGKRLFESCLLLLRIVCSNTAAAVHPPISLSLGG